MTIELLTNTAVRIPVGPLVDPTDGKTIEGALTVADMTVEIEHADGTGGGAVTRIDFIPAASGSDNDMALVTSSAHAIYDLELTAGNVNWLGSGKISFYDVDGFLVYWDALHVVSANYYNNKYGTTIENVTVTSIGNDVITPASVDEDADFVIQALSITNALDAGSVLVDGAAVITGELTVSDGIDVSCSTGDKDAVKIVGDGTGHGMSIDSGSGVTGNGISINSSATNGQGIYSRGNGAGAGIRGDGGGANASGFYGVGSSNGHGMVLTGDGSGEGLYALGGPTGNGMELKGGSTSGDGLKTTAATSGHGINAKGGDAGSGVTAESGGGATGDGIHGTSVATNGNGIYGLGAGDMHGLSANGAGDGDGINALGGATGDGIHAKAPATGHGIAAHGGGVAGDGLHAEADNEGDGIEGVGAGAGVDIKGDITGDLTGLVSGTVAGVTPSAAGDAMNLAADAIKAVSYDESTAFPLTAVDGSTLTEAGGTGDHLTAIDLPNQTMDITGSLSGSVGSVAANGITSTSMAADSINAAALKADALAAINAEVDTALNTAIPGVPTAGSINDYVKRSKYMLCNRWDITEANGNSEIFNDAGASFSAVAGAFTTLAGVTLRKKVI